MIKGKPYQYPPAAFQPGDLVRFYLSDDVAEHGKGAFEVQASDHCFTWFNEFPHQISNWRLKKVEIRIKQKTRQKASGDSRKRDLKENAKIDCKKSTSSGNPLGDICP